MHGERVEYSPEATYSGLVTVIGIEWVVIECNGRTGDYVYVPAGLFKRTPEPGLHLATVERGRVVSVKKRL